MSFKYTGFISYRRNQWCRKCASFFNNILQENEECYGSGIFFDDKDIEVRNDIDEKIADGIYESMSLLFFFVPVSIIESNPYCAWELAFFSEYERLRIEKLKKINPHLDENDCNQIIPILIKGEEKDLPELLKNRKFVDFRTEMLVLRKNSRSAKKAYKEIIDSFNNLRKTFAGFENVGKIPMPSRDFAVSAETVGHKQPFPTIVLKN